MPASDIALIITAASPVILGIIGFIFHNNANKRASETVPAHVVTTVANCNPPTPPSPPATDEVKP